MDRKYTYQVKTAVGEFRDFVAGHKKTGLLTALIILATWSVLGFRSDIGVDTEIMIAFPETMLKSWCGIGRFGLVFTKRLFGISLFCQPVSAIAMMAVPCGVWAFGSYQVTVVIFIALCAFSFLLVYQRGLVFVGIRGIN